MWRHPAPWAPNHIWLSPLRLKIMNSLAVQWLGLGAVTAKGTGLIPGRGTKIPQATWPKKTEDSDSKWPSWNRCFPQICSFPVVPSVNGATTQPTVTALLSHSRILLVSTSWAPSPSTHLTPESSSPPPQPPKSILLHLLMDYFAKASKTVFLLQ